MAAWPVYWNLHALGAVVTWTQAGRGQTVAQRPRAAGAAPRRVVQGEAERTLIQGGIQTIAQFNSGGSSGPSIASRGEYPTNQGRVPHL